MPLYFLKEIKNHSKIILWNLVESQEEILKVLKISKEEEKKLIKLTPKRKREYLGIRLVLNYWNSKAQIFYNEKGAPGLKNLPHLNISISHCENKIALAISNYEIGIDIEKYRENQILTVSKKFLRNDEAFFIEEKIKPQQLQVIWGIKESLYKITKGLFTNFLENYKVFKFDLNQNKINCKLISPLFESILEAHYEKKENYFLVYIINDKNERIH